MSAILTDRLRRWQAGDLVSLWEDARIEGGQQLSAVRKKKSLGKLNAQRALFLAKEGRFRDAMRSLNSQGCAQQNDTEALQELHQLHPNHQLPEWSDSLPASLCVNSELVLEILKKFPRASSPGYSKLRAQHLLDAILGTTAPSAQDCLESLTRWICLALSGSFDRRIAPWLTGAPLTALYKKQDQQGGVRPIAVGETLRRLISRICCASVRFLAARHLPSV